MRFYGLISFILSIHFASFALAGERYDFYDGVRGLGMGNAVVATVNDETALYLNPAALGRLRNYFLTLIDPEVDLGSQTQSMVGTNVTDSMSPQKTLDDANNHQDKHLHERMQISPSFVVTNFGFGALAKYQTDAFYDSTNSKYHYDFINDYAAVMGFDLRMFDGRIKIGVNGKFIDRTESHRTDIPISTTGMTGNTNIAGSTVFSEGQGLGSDAGLILTAPWVSLPTLAVVYRDIGVTSYTINHGMNYSTTQRPARTPSTIDAGFSFTPILSKGTRITITGQLSDVTQKVEPTDVYVSPSITRRIHGGMELNIYDIFFVRAGYNQGYWTAGFEMDVGNSQLQIASYGEEIGDVPLASATPATTYKPTEDRRYVAKFAYRF